MSYAYYRWFPGDYQRDTMHLGWYEDLAYRRLIDLYNVTGKPLRNDRAYLLRAVRATEPEQQQAVDTVLTEFFELRPDGWHQVRCDAEVKYRKGLSDAGRHAVMAREKQRAIKAARTPDDRSVIGRSSNQNQNQNQNQKDLSQKQKNAASRKRAAFVFHEETDLPDWIPREQWHAWIEARTKRKHPPTDWALRMAIAKLADLREQGHQPAALLARSAFNGWSDFFPEKEAIR